MKKSRLLGAVCVCFLRSKYFSYIALLITSCIPSFAVAQTYNFTALDSLGGTISHAYAINNSGQIVGDSWTTGDATSHATVWIDTVPTVLTSGAVAEGINISGQIAGQSIVSGSGWRATVWNGTTPTVLDTLLGTLHSDAWDINDSGQVAGRSIIDSAYHATVWNGLTPTDLGADSAAYAINNSGQVVGSLNASGPLGGTSNHAAIWNGTTATDLGTLGGTNSEAQDINNSGLVVGNSHITGDTERHATLWNETGPIDLGTLGGTNSVARAINDAGMVVGYSGTTDNTATHATLWDGTTIIDLNTLLDASTISDGWVLLHAYDINDYGWIVGRAKNSITGEIRHAFLLTPTAVPLPPALWLFGSGLLGLIGVARKKVA